MQTRRLRVACMHLLHRVLQTLAGEKVSRASTNHPTRVLHAFCDFEVPHRNRNILLLIKTVIENHRIELGQLQFAVAVILHAACCCSLQTARIWPNVCHFNLNLSLCDQWRSARLRTVHHQSADGTLNGLIGSSNIHTIMIGILSFFGEFFQIVPI